MGAASGQYTFFGVIHFALFFLLRGWYVKGTVKPSVDGMCKILLDGADEWKKMGRRSII